MSQEESASMAHPKGERTPLLLEKTSSCSDEIVEEERTVVVGHATVWQTILNISKTCMGTGTLALPFAARQGGVVLNTCGMLAIVGWNIFSVQRLCLCLELLPQKKRSREPPEGTSALSTVAFHALGPMGMHAVDMMFVILLIGVVVAYVDGILSFLRDTPLTTGSEILNALIVAIIIGTLSNVPDMGYLSRMSAIGLCILFLTFVVIACYGNFDGFSANLWPQNGLEGISHWFGCAVFGFGTVPLTYNLRESMTEPQCILLAQFLGLTATALAYITIGNGMLLLYPDIEGDILQALPTVGALPTLVRLSMIVVVLTTAPLLVVPCGELLEGKIFGGNPEPPIARISVRLGICMLCTGISVFVSGFVNVLSLVGCCCVAVVSFVIPPLLHIFLSRPPSLTSLPTNEHCAEVGYAGLWLDIFMLIWGVAATVISSVYTFRVLLDA